MDHNDDLITERGEAEATAIIMDDARKRRPDVREV
jgi:hypothetical protein